MEQLFITDLDHTFLSSNQLISPYSKKVWRRVSKTNPLSVATARSFSKTKEFFNRVRMNSPLILLDGAMLVTPKKKLIEIRTLNRDMVNSIIDESRGFDIQPFIIALKDVKTLEESFLLPPVMNRYQSILIEESYRYDPRMEFRTKLDGVDNTLKMTYMGDESTLRPLAEHIKEVFGDELEVKLAPENYMGCYFLTILHPKSDKANALKSLSEYLDIPLEKTTVFGDSLNDIGMFKIAGTSVAVGNALDEVKKIATVVLPYTNDDDGVARYLEHVVTC